jgi:hypothetical protein
LRRTVVVETSFELLECGGGFGVGAGLFGFGFGFRTLEKGFLHRRLRFRGGHSS